MSERFTSLLPSCARCVVPTGPESCARRDWATEHAFPCGHAGYLLEIQLAGMASHLDRAFLRQCAVEELVAGRYAQSVEEARGSISTFDQVWLAGKAVQGAIRKARIRYTPAMTEQIAFTSGEGERRECLLRYCMIPSPDPSHFTMAPVLIPQQHIPTHMNGVTLTEVEQQRIYLSTTGAFVEDCYYPDECIFGPRMKQYQRPTSEERALASTQWVRSWYTFWETSGITADDWRSEYGEVVEGVRRGALSIIGLDADRPMAQTLAHLTQMVEQSYRLWQSPRKA